MRMLVIIPTYNELENITKLIPIILGLKEEMEVLVVDDNSPDGTGNYVEHLSSENNRIHILKRAGKMGLGSAYIEGFKWALKQEPKFDYIFQMDADFSHEPEKLIEFIEKLKKYDVVIGSRYLNGVSVVNWPIKRLILSYFANWYARTFAGIKIRDCTGGFKGFRRIVLEKIPFEYITSDGYAFQIEMNYFAQKLGFKMFEVPIIFVDRHSGTSKLSRRIVYEAIFKVIFLFFDRIFNIKKVKR
ncbi:MAG: polyprenol monophosphomannose synthase [Proteobacteria bacterium]|nr:polyprenol monophosphomannose synthase [Pseudomonadota bacterium]